MKTFISLMTLVLMTFTSQAQSFVSRSFLSGNSTNYYVSALTTNTFGSTNTQYMVNGNLKTNALGIVNVSNFANRDGTAANGNISISLVGTNAPATNIITFVFQSIPNLKAGVTTGAQNKFSVAVTANGTTAVVVATNLPTAFLQGCQYIQLTSFGSSNAGTNCFVNDVSLNGFAP